MISTRAQNDLLQRTSDEQLVKYMLEIETPVIELEQLNSSPTSYSALMV